MLRDDVRSAARSVVRARAVTAVLLTSLAIGTGANATVFGAIRSCNHPPQGGRGRHFRAAGGRRLRAVLVTSPVALSTLLLLGTGVMISSLSTALEGGRTREIGLRVALDAARTQIARLVLTEAIAVAALGMAVGLVPRVAAGRLTATWLAGVEPIRLEALYTAPAILIAMIAAAAVIPLRQALRVSATIALKAE